MAEAPGTRLWVGRVTFLAICLVIVFVRLLPLETLPIPEFPVGFEEGDRLPPVGLIWPMPDILLAVATVWAMRRPDYVPAVVIAGVFLVTDLLFHRPPGLWAALVLLLTEFLRARSNGMRAMPFLVEWTTVAIGIAVITVIDRMVLALVDIPQAALSLSLMQMVLTCAIYPVVVVVAHVVFRVSRPAPGEVDALGHRL